MTDGFLTLLTGEVHLSELQSSPPASVLTLTWVPAMQTRQRSQRPWCAAARLSRTRLPLITNKSYTKKKPYAEGS